MSSRGPAAEHEAQPAQRRVGRTAHSPANGRGLRVMTFNILSATGGLHVGPWETRRDLVVSTIRAFDPDLLGAQEVQDPQAADLRRELAEYGYLDIGWPESPRKLKHTAIFYRRSRFRKVEAGTFWLSRTPDVPGSRDWFAAKPKTASWVALEAKADGRVPLYFFNTHFDLISRRARLKSVDLLRERVRAIAGDAPAVITGDFNTHAGRKTYRRLLDDADGHGLRLVDSYREAHPDPQPFEGTWHGRGLRSRRRIDWILHTHHLVCVDAGIDRSSENGRYASDHHPVWAVLAQR